MNTLHDNLQYMTITYWCHSRCGVQCFTVDSISETEHLYTLGMCLSRESHTVASEIEGQREREEDIDRISRKY